MTAKPTMGTPIGPSPEAMEIESQARTRSLPPSAIVSLYRRLDPHRPKSLSPRALLSIIECGRIVHDAQSVVGAVRDLMEEHPGNHAVPKALWEAAQAQMEAGQADVGIATLRFLALHHPTDPFADQARGFLRDRAAPVATQRRSSVETWAPRDPSMLLTNAAMGAVFDANDMALSSGQPPQIGTHDVGAIELGDVEPLEIVPLADDLGRPTASRLDFASALEFSPRAKTSDSVSPSDSRPWQAARATSSLEFAPYPAPRSEFTTTPSSYPGVSGSGPRSIISPEGVRRATDGPGYGPLIQYPHLGTTYRRDGDDLVVRDGGVLPEIDLFTGAPAAERGQQITVVRYPIWPWIGAAMLMLLPWPLARPLALVFLMVAVAALRQAGTITYCSSAPATWWQLIASATWLTGCGLSFIVAMELARAGVLGPITPGDSTAWAILALSAILPVWARACHPFVVHRIAGGFLRLRVRPPFWNGLKRWEDLHRP